MKKIYNFFDRASLLKIWLVLYIILNISIIITLYLIGNISNKLLFENNIDYIKFSMLFSIILSTVLTVNIEQVRLNINFNDYLKYVENLISKTNTKEEFKSIYEYEFQELVAKAKYSHHKFEVNKIKFILEMSIKHCKN